jgi:hypothetical protein
MREDRSKRPLRILLGHLGARGDVVYATAVTRQIKADFPGCHLTWAVGSMCRSIIEGNPYVDEIWEIPLKSHAEMIAAWEAFHAEAETRRRRGDFDKVFYTQVYPDNFRNFDGTVRASIFRGYPHPMEVPVTPVIRLSSEEIARVKQFAERNRLLDHSRVILFEFTSGSGQTFVDADFALRAAGEIVRRIPDVKVILASHTALSTDCAQVIDGSELGFRENAELTKYCSLLIGCSSGLSWLCTSDWAKPLPKIQLLKQETSVFASFVHDHERFGLPTDQIIEMTDCSVEHLADCVEMVVSFGVAAARARFHETIEPDFKHYAQTLRFVLRRSGPMAVFESLFHTAKRYALRKRLFSALARIVISKFFRTLSRSKP